MDELEKLKQEVQLLKSKAARKELIYKIKEREKDIERIKEHIAKQEELIEELETELKE